VTYRVRFSSWKSRVLLRAFRESFHITLWYITLTAQTVLFYIFITEIWLSSAYFPSRKTHGTIECVYVSCLSFQLFNQLTNYKEIWNFIGWFITLYYYYYYSIALCRGFATFFQFLNSIHNRQTLWTGDQPVARPLPTHRTTQTHNKHTVIHTSSGIRTHDPSVWAATFNCAFWAYISHECVILGLRRHYSHQVQGWMFCSAIFSDCLIQMLIQSNGSS
jgi:hypothetical protein